MSRISRSRPLNRLSPSYTLSALESRRHGRRFAEIKWGSYLGHRRCLVRRLEPISLFLFGTLSFPATNVTQANSDEIGQATAQREGAESN